MADVTIYHNPKCSKSRQTLALLKEAGVDHEVVEYLTDTPDENTLADIVRKLGIEPKELIRKKERREEVGEDAASMTAQEIIKKMVAHPRTIERPIVVKGDKAKLGRPPEQVLEIV